MLQDFPMYAYIPARDLARARKFYETKLGFHPKEETNGGVVYEFAGGTACFLYPTPNAGTSKASQAFWRRTAGAAGRLDEPFARGMGGIAGAQGARAARAGAHRRAQPGLHRHRAPAGGGRRPHRLLQSLQQPAHVLHA